MIKSMTGYGRARQELHKRDITVEVRSVNNRYLDCTVKMPRMYAFAEDAVKKHVQQAVSRGKVDVFITVDATAADVVKVAVNRELAAQYAAALGELSDVCGTADYRPAPETLARFPDVPAYTAEREVLARLTGYTLTRGVLCAMRRPQLPDAEAVCAGARRVAVLEGVADSTNVGALFRSAAALGVSESLYEAAEIDGATGLQKFFYVTIPGIRDTIGFCVVTTLIMALQVFDQIYVMTGGGPQYATETLVGYIYNRGFQTAPYDLGYASAIAVYLFCMIAIITVILRKYAFPQGGDET